MTLGGRLASLFPCLHLMSIGAAAYFCPLLLVAALYALPVIAYRIHNLFFPLLEGKSRLDLPQYSPWWASHQFQALFNAFPALEAFLRLIPGAYSVWLRLWGSAIGSQVHWTLRMEVLDRGLLEVGDQVIFGHLVTLCPHVVFRKRGKTSLYVAKIKIGKRAFIGAASKFGPGTEIAQGQVVPFQTLLTIDKGL